NLDDLRKMMYGNDPWKSWREQEATRAEQSIVTGALSSAVNVVVDDTHILGSGVHRWDSVIEAYKPVVEIVDMTKETSLKECITRDSIRQNFVGRGVIERMALFGGLIDLSKLDNVVVCDIDGTVANLTHRLHYIENEPKNYDAFFSQVLRDWPIHEITRALETAVDWYYKIIFLSGRPTSCGAETASWLSAYCPPYEHLFMRNSGDHKDDAAAKREIMEQMFKCGLRRDAIRCIIDDRPSVCEVWRSMGLPLIQVKDGIVVQIEESAVGE